MQTRINILAIILACFASLVQLSSLSSQECGVIYVSPSGASSGAAGTRTNPASISFGLSLVNASNNRVWLASGNYPISQPLLIPSNVTIEGGFTPGTWIKSNSAPSIIQRDPTNVIPAPALALVALVANNATDFRLQDLTIDVASATLSQVSVYGIYLSGCSNYNIVRCSVITGNAGNGLPGANGAPGTPGTAGAPGLPAANEQNVPAGGAGGTGGNNGGAGGQGARHNPQAAATGNTGGGGCGGGGGNYGDGPGCGCGVFGSSNNSGCGGSSPTAGLAGGSGTNGSNGSTGPAGSVVGGYFIAGGVAPSGTNGTPGCGGGGGGGGAGRQQPGSDDVGGSGGGGGGGGEGGNGGGGGTGGGGSFAIFLVNNGVNGLITDCALSPGAGGIGGVGGTGGIGGTGGTGGAGGPGFGCGISNGAAGGAGGSGGNGGNGGNGSDGPSIALSENGGTPISQSNIVGVPGSPPIINVDNYGCTNAAVTFTSPVAGNWNFGIGANPSTGSGSGPISVLYSTTGRKSITFSGTNFLEFIDIFQQGAILPSISPTNPSVNAGCELDFSTSIQGSFYDWDFGPAASPSTVSATNANAVTDVFFLTPGTYVIYVNVTTTCCGIIRDSTTVTVSNTTLNTSISATDTTICDGESVTFSASGAFSVFNFFLNNNPIQTGPSNTLLLNNLINGDQIVVFGFDGTCFTSPSETLSVVVNPIPNVSLSSSDPDNTICEGESVTFIAQISGLDNYEFFDGNVSLQSGPSNSYTTTSLTSGNAISVVATQLGCMSPNSQSISTTVNALPITSLSSSDSDNSICENDAVTFTANPLNLSSYEFFLNGNSVQTGASNTFSTSSLVNGDAVTVQGLSSAGCIGVISLPVTTQVFLYPVVTISSSDPDDQICSQDAILFTAIPLGLSSYTFYNNGSIIQTGPNNTYSTTSLPAINSITVEASENGCTGQQSLSITTVVNQASLIDAGNDFNACLDAISVTLNPSPVGGSWTGNGITNANGTFSPNAAGVGDHTLVYQYTNPNNCVSSDSLISTVKPLPTVNFSSTAVCEGSQTLFTDMSVISAPDSLIEWNWDFGDSNISTNKNPMHTYATNGTFSVTLQVTSSSECTSDTVLDAIVYSNPIADFNALPTEGCIPLTVRFLYVDGNGGTPVTWAWDFGNGTSSGSESPAPIDYTSDGSYSVNLIVTTVEGCNDTISKTNYITAYPRPVAAMLIDPANVGILDPSVTINDLSEGAVGGSYAFGDGNTVEITPSLVYLYSDTGKFQVSQLVINQYGCRDSTFSWVNVRPDYAFYIPNAFTPNADVKNELFSPKGIGIKDFEMRIFNRWGEEIFRTKDIEKGWNGRFRLDDKYVEQGIYSYIIFVLDQNDDSHNYSGHITVLRGRDGKF